MPRYRFDKPLGGTHTPRKDATKEGTFLERSAASPYNAKFMKLVETTKWYDSFPPQRIAKGAEALTRDLWLRMHRTWSSKKHFSFSKA